MRKTYLVMEFADASFAIIVKTAFLRRKPLAFSAGLAG
jgi:hypothetical protein